jgi:hypothetical protein
VCPATANPGWNTALRALEQLEQEYTVVRRTELLPLDEAEQHTVRNPPVKLSITRICRSQGGGGGSGGAHRTERG